MSAAASDNQDEQISSNKNIFRISSLPTSRVRFKEWGEKMTENTKLSFGAAILTYEYAIGTTKGEKSRFVFSL